MDSSAVAQAIDRMAEEIGGQLANFHQLVIAGVPTRGVEVAKRIASRLSERAGTPLQAFSIDVSMHRDDLARQASIRPVAMTSLPSDIEDRVVLLVDDVLFTGRSCRAALEAICSFGRPAAVRFAVLVDRIGHLELPVRPDFVGATIETSYSQKIRVRFQNLDGVEDSVQIVGE